MAATSTAVAIGATLLSLSVVCAQTPSSLPSEMPQHSLATAPSRLAAGPDAVRVTWRSTTKEAKGTVRLRRSTTAAAVDGLFGNLEFLITPGKPQPGDEYAKYFVYGGGSALACAYAEGSRYTETAFAKPHDILDPAPQFGLAPWAMVPRWLEAMELVQVHPTPLPQGVRYQASFPKESRHFALEFGLSHELTAFEIGLRDSRLRWEYSAFETVAGRPMPQRLREYTTSAGDPAGGVSDEWSAVAESFEIDTPAAREATRFDPVRLNVRFFDEATGDVYAPDKSHKLLNVNERSGNTTQSPWAQRGWILGILAVAGVSAGRVWYRFRNAGR